MKISLLNFSDNINETVVCLVKCRSNFLQISVIIKQDLKKVWKLLRLLVDKFGIKITIKERFILNNSAKTLLLSAVGAASLFVATTNVNAATTHKVVKKRYCVGIITEV